jgi:hypothetical protein
VNWCLIGDSAVNAYVEPIYMADVDFVVGGIPDGLENFRAKALRVQFSIDPVYRCFISRSEIRKALPAVSAFGPEDALLGSST